MFYLHSNKTAFYPKSLFFSASYRSESLGILGITSPPSKTSSLEHNSKLMELLSWFIFVVDSCYNVRCCGMFFKIF